MERISLTRKQCGRCVQIAIIRGGPGPQSCPAHHNSRRRHLADTGQLRTKDQGLSTTRHILGVPHLVTWDFYRVLLSLKHVFLALYLNNMTQVLPVSFLPNFDVSKITINSGKIAQITTTTYCETVHCQCQGEGGGSSRKFYTSLCEVQFRCYVISLIQIKDCKCFTKL